VDRRQFLAQGSVSAALLALAACGLDPTAPNTGPSLTNPIVLADHAELASTGGRLFGRIGSAPVVIERTGERTFLALSLVCPHQGATIGTAGSGFRCPQHGAMFDANGNWTGGQPTSRMASYAVTYDPEAGTLTIG
jgi:thiosulfate dehydrogenase [quinone] large subunit